MVNVDTDMIIPKQFLKTIKRTGLKEGLFYEMRWTADGQKKDFVLDQPAYQNAKILVAGPNFGCGSSREHAPWALLDFGIRCIISEDFADIFYNNCFKNGILPIKLPKEIIDKLMDDASRGSNAIIEVDLEKQEIKGPDGGTRPFRHRSVPQALPAERPRRYRPHHGEEVGDRRLRGAPEVAALAAALALRDAPHPERRDCDPILDARMTLPGLSSTRTERTDTWRPTAICWCCPATASAPKS